MEGGTKQQISGGGNNQGHNNAENHHMPPPPGMYHPPGYPQMQMGGGQYGGGPPMMPGQPNMAPLPQYDEKYIEHLNQVNHKLNEIRDEIEHMPKNDLEQFKDQKLPLARIKKIMKSDEDVRMISAEAPILFAKACEMFIVEMTRKAYYYADRSSRKTLQRNDIAAAITDTEIYDFLLDVMPRDEIMQSAKDKQMSTYQLQLLDDVFRLQQLQSNQQLQQPPQLPQFMQPGMPPPMSGGYIGPPPGLPALYPPQNIADSKNQDSDNEGGDDSEEDEAEERKKGEEEEVPKKRGRKPNKKQ